MIVVGWSGKPFHRRCIAGRWALGSAVGCAARDLKKEVSYLHLYGSSIVVDHVIHYKTPAASWGMIRSFGNRGTEDIFNWINSRTARRVCPPMIWPTARRKLDQLNAAVSLRSLDIPPGNRLEALKGRRKGQHSIRINEQYRVCFVWTVEGAEHVEVVDYH